MLSATFRFVLPDISNNSVLKDLLRSFRIERPISSSRFQPWDLTLVLRSLTTSAFEPLQACSLRQLTKKTLFLLALASAKRIGELQAITKEVSFKDGNAFLSYLPEFIAKTESEANPIPRFFELKSLNEFVGDLQDELLLCPVRCLKEYIARTKILLPHPRSLFVSPRNPSRQISKNAVSFFIREVISQAVVNDPSPGPSTRVRAHSVRAMSTSTAFWKNASLSSIIQAASWKSPSVFSSFYLKDVQFASDQGFSLGPFVAANHVVT